MRFLLVHQLHCHYEMIPSFISYFSKLGELDIVMGDILCISGELSDEIAGWKKVFDACGEYKLYTTSNFTCTKPYDYILMDTEDYINNWKWLNLNLMKYPMLTSVNSKIIGVCHDKKTIVSKVSTLLYMQGIDKNLFYYCGVNLISTDKKFKIVNATPKINVAIVGDIVNREHDFLEVLTKRIKNYQDIQFHFVNRHFSTNFLEVIDKYEITIKMYTNLNASTMMSLLFTCDAMYYYPEVLSNIGTKSTGSLMLAYSTLCKLICPSEYIVTANMNPSSGFFLVGPNDSVTISKLSMDDISHLHDDHEYLSSSTSASISSILSK